MADTREYIIEKAYSLFLNHSYEGVSINDISKAIGLTKGALYHHFASKEELFKAVIDKYLFIKELKLEDTNISFPEYIDIVVEHARNTFDSILKKSKAFQPLNYISLIIDALRHYPEFNVKKNEYFSSDVQQITKILENAVARKEIRADIDINITAITLFSLMYSIATNVLQTDDSSIEDVANKSLEILRSQLNEFYKLLKV